MNKQYKLKVQLAKIQIKKAKVAKWKMILIWEIKIHKLIKRLIKNKIK